MTTLAAPRRTLPLAGVVGVGLAAAVVIALVHVTQGTADVGVRDLLALLFGGPDEQAAAVVVASRLPRLTAGVVVGVALGVAGAALQSLARNPLASPDTLGVNAGAYVALVLAAVFAVALPVPFAGGLAFVGGLAAAGLVLVLASGAGAGPTRLVLAGSAIALALDAVTVTLLLLFREHTVGLFAWGSGSLSQYGGDGAGLDDAGGARGRGRAVRAGRAAGRARPRRRRRRGARAPCPSTPGVAVVLLAVALSAAAVTVAGPVGFVGLAAPAIVRLLGPRVPGLLRHRALLPVSALSGVVVVLGADVVVRWALGAQVGGVEVPTGVVTIAGRRGVRGAGSPRRFRGSGPTRPAADGAARAAGGRGGDGRGGRARCSSPPSPGRCSATRCS